ncbi:MAG: hypothetical protein H6918_08985 [Sphingomonadaceae bacterium]|nr:hypothetical protein [Sphingomonadaceae bacterium]
MRGMMLLSACALLASCGEPDAVQESAANTLEPGKILYPDIEANQLFGASCAFVPDGGGIGAIALAMEDAGYMKLDGQIVRFAEADEAQQLGADSMAFVSDSASFTLTLDRSSERARADTGTEFNGELLVRDTTGASMYQARGLIQCGA